MAARAKVLCRAVNSENHWVTSARRRRSSRGLTRVTAGGSRQTRSEETSELDESLRFPCEKLLAETLLSRGGGGVWRRLCCGKERVRRVGSSEAEDMT